MYDKDAPIHYTDGISGIKPHGPNYILSFSVLVPGRTEAENEQRINLRLVIPKQALAQNVAFLSQAIEAQEALGSTGRQGGQTDSSSS